MAINVTCPGCRTRLSVADRYAGKVVRCKRCHGRVTVTATVMRR